MFRISRRTLTFPELVYKGKVSFGRGKGETALFTLDWHRFVEDFHYHRGELPLPVVHDQYQPLIDGPFAIPINYLREIRHFSQFAIIDRSRERSFDVPLRETCYSVSDAAANVSFKLLADCHFDTANNYFYRGPDKILVQYALMFAFWANQTSKALVEKQAQIHELEILLELDGKDLIPQEELDEVRKYLNSIKALKASWERIDQTQKLSKDEQELFKEFGECKT